MNTSKGEMSSYEYAQANQFIYNMYMKYGRGMDFEECRAIAFLEYAEVRYELGDIYNREIMWEYARERIESAFEQARKIRNKKIELEGKISLNQTYGDSDEPVYTYLFPVHGDFVKSLCMWNNIKEWGGLKYNILLRLYRGEEDAEIMNGLKLSGLEYYEIKRELRERLALYTETL